MQASETRCAELCLELSITRDELTRVSAVAARVAASENKAGLRAEGTIAVRAGEEHRSCAGCLCHGGTLMQGRLKCLADYWAAGHDTTGNIMC
jgi:hypothetical protein